MFALLYACDLCGMIVNFAACSRILQFVKRIVSSFMLSTPLSSTQQLIVIHVNKIVIVTCVYFERVCFRAVVWSVTNGNFLRKDVHF